MTQFVLVRPGATAFDREERIQGSLDVPLSPEGMRCIATVAEQLVGLHLDRVYAGPHEPHRTTALLIGMACGCKVRSMKELCGIRMGLWEGLSREQLRRKHPRVYKQWLESPETVCPPDGESLQEVYARVRKLLQGLMKRHRREERVAIVASEPLASLIRCCLRGEGLAGIPVQQDGSPQWEVVEVSVVDS